MNFSNFGGITALTPDCIDIFAVKAVTNPGQSGWTSVICSAHADDGKTYKDVSIVLPPSDSCGQLKVYSGDQQINPAIAFICQMILVTCGKKELNALVRKWSKHNSTSEVGTFKWASHLDCLLGQYFSITGTPTCVSNDRGCNFFNGDVFANKKTSSENKVEMLMGLLESIGHADESIMDQEAEKAKQATPANASTPSG